MENLYCSIFIVDISQNPDEVDTVSSRIQQLIEDHGGVIKTNNRWGKRRMAYSIEGKTHGFYVEIEFTAGSRLNIPKILEDEFTLNDRVLRYMTYVVDKKELIQRAKRAGKTQEEKGPKPAKAEETKPAVQEKPAEKKQPEAEAAAQEKPAEEKKPEAETAATEAAAETDEKETPAETPAPTEEKSEEKE